MFQNVGPPPPHFQLFRKESQKRNLPFGTALSLRQNPFEWYIGVFLRNWAPFWLASTALRGPPPLPFLKSHAYKYLALKIPPAKVQRFGRELLRGFNRFWEPFCGIAEPDVVSL